MALISLFLGFPKNIPSYCVANLPVFYFDTLYPLQDRVLNIVKKLDTGFYLTGGTASSRGYLQHRFSDDFIVRLFDV